MKIRTKVKREFPKKSWVSKRKKAVGSLLFPLTLKFINRNLAFFPPSLSALVSRNFSLTLHAKLDLVQS